MWVLEKYSLPNDWKMEFGSQSEAVAELRRHICENCLIGPSLYVGKDGQLEELDFLDEPPVDIIHDGVRFECRDVSTLLGTSCGLEFGLYDPEDEI